MRKLPRPYTVHHPDRRTFPYPCDLSFSYIAGAVSPVPAEFLSCLLIFYQQPDEAGREAIHDYAWAAVQLLIDEGCVELVAPPTTREWETKVARGKRRVAAHPPPPAKRPKPQQGTPLGGDVVPSVGRVSGHTEIDHGAGKAERWLVPTKLGLAIFRSSMSPADGLVVYRDLSGRVDARRLCVGTYTGSCVAKGAGKEKYFRAHAEVSGWKSV